MAPIKEKLIKNQITQNTFKEKILSNRSLMAFVGLVFMIVCLSLISPYFLTTSNILNVFRQVSIISIISIGMTYVIISGGIDLSVGSIVALSSLISAILMKENFNVTLSIIIGICVGGLAGLINGLMITTRLQIVPFIATLAMLSIARGITLVITGGMPIYNLPKSFGFLGAGYILGVPVPVIINIFIYIVGIYFLNHTRTGLYFYAIGGNEEASRLSGINVAKVRTIGYVLSGVLSAIGGIILASRITSVEPIAGSGYELECIAAAVIGGTSMSGGYGSLIGTFIGALIMGFLRNGLNLLDVSVYWQQVVIGVVIAVTVAISTVRKKE